MHIEVLGYSDVLGFQAELCLTTKLLTLGIIVHCEK